MSTPRLIDLIPSGAGVPEDEPTPDTDVQDASDPVESVFEFPDRPQPSVRETVGRMVREVIVPGEPSAEEMEQREPLDIRSAFDRGARLSMPEPPEAEVDPALKARPTRTPRPRASVSRPAGSDQFTDLFAAGMILIIAFSLGDEFQPTEDEAKDLARPLGNILARRVDLATKLGQDANDVVAFAIALMAYGVRVGPIAGQKVRTAYDDRQRRSRVDAVSGPGRTADDPTQDGLPIGFDAGASSRNGATGHAQHALAQARRVGLGVVDRDLGATTRRRAPLADHG